jgi:glycerophosphoryl diester phosphodiesterase
MKKPYIIAHRYGNDLSRLAAAAEAGADYVEVDVWLQRGRLEVRHERTMGPLPFYWDKWRIWRKRGKPLPLDDVLAALPERMGVMLDLKGTERDMPEAILQALRRHGHGHPVMVSSRFWDHLPSLIDYPDILLFFSVGRPWEMWRVRRLLELRENDAICVRYGMLSADEVRDLKTKVALVSTWGINDDERLERVLEWGVDAIITDEVSIMRKIAAIRGEKPAVSLR